MDVPGILVRVMGSGDFVDGLKQDVGLRDKMKSVVTLSQLLVNVSSATTLEAEMIIRRGKSRAPAVARALMCHPPIYQLGYTGKEIGKFLHLGPTGVCLASRRGEKILKENPGLLKDGFVERV